MPRFTRPVPDHEATHSGVRQDEVLEVIVQSSGKEAFIAAHVESGRRLNIVPEMSQALLVEVVEQPGVPDDEFSSIPSREGMLHPHIATKIVLDRGDAEGREHLIGDVIHPPVNSWVFLQQLNEGAFRMIRDDVGIQQAVAVGLLSKD